MRFTVLLCSALLICAAGSASATPVVRSAQLTLTVSLSEVSETVAVSNPAANVTVDEEAGTISIAPGLLAGADSAPVSSNSLISSLSLTVSTHATATFEQGGATALEPPCPIGGPAVGEACAAGTGIGGDLGLVGFLNVPVINFTYHFPLSPASNVDHAPFTLGTAWIRRASGTLLIFHGSVSTGLSQISLVSPTSLVFDAYAVRHLTITFTDGLGLPDFVLSAPEPAPLALIGSGIVGLACTVRRRRDT